MNTKHLTFFLLLQLTFCAFFCQKSTAQIPKFQHPFYIGASAGYGATTWSGLVPAPENQNEATNMSTPINASEGGGIWGAFAGYEISPSFALETNYMHFPNAQVIFDEFSIFQTDHETTVLNTQTETVNVMGKFMIFVPNTLIRVFSSVGGAGIRRSDILYEGWHISPTFGLGFNYNFTPHLMSEIVANYTAGYGEAQLNPTDLYFPFLYSLSMRLAYRF